MERCTMLTSTNTLACRILDGKHVPEHVEADKAVNNTELEQPAKAVQLRRQVLALLSAVA